jgi:hypothetical protein
MAYHITNKIEQSSTISCMTYGVYMRRTFFLVFIRARVELLWDSARGPITDRHMAKRTSLEFKGAKLKLQQL